MGLANSMELAMDELSTMFPEILRGETKSSNRYEGLNVLIQHQSMSPRYLQYIVVDTRMHAGIIQTN